MGRRHYTQEAEIENILSIIRSRLEDIQQFFQRDQSFALSKLNFDPRTDDARLVALLPAVEGEEYFEAQLRRLLATRSLALQRAANESVSMSEFLRDVGLSASERDAVRQGERARQIEIGTGVAGSSFLLLPCFARLIGLNDEQVWMLINKLIAPDFQPYLQKAGPFTPLVHSYQQGFDNDITFYR